MIKDDFIGTNKFNTSSFSSNEIPQKMVTWILDPSNDLVADKAEAGKSLLSAITEFLKQNEEILYNLGGDRIKPNLQSNKLIITKLQVVELWKKIDKKVMFDPIGIKIYMNDSALTEIQYRDMLKMEIKIGSTSWVDFIREKNFQYNITQINNQIIPRREAFQYQKGMLTYDWSKITDFVKYY